MGGNGAFKKLLDLILFGLAGYLGFFDGYTKRLLEIFGKNPWYSETLIYAKSQLRISTWLGYTSLFLTGVLVLIDDTLSTYNKAAQIFTNMLGFGLTVWIGAAIASISAIPVTLTAILTFGVAIGLFQAISLINLTYFSFYFLFRRRYA